MNDITSKQTILIVDDTPANLSFLSGLLPAAYRVKVATNGMMDDDIRWRWQHSIPPVKALRYSITFRTAA